MGDERETSTRGRDRRHPDDGGGGMPKDDVYRALAVAPRRRLLAYLLEHETERLDDLAAMLVGWETTETGGVADDEAFRRMRIALAHSHIPMLADVGLVEYEQSTGTVTLTRDESTKALVRSSLEAIA